MMSAVQGELEASKDDPFLLECTGELYERLMIMIETNIHR